MAAVTQNRYVLFIHGNEVGHHNNEDSGLDLLFTDDIHFEPLERKKINLNIYARMYDRQEQKFIAYYMALRSSVAKTTFIQPRDEVESVTELDVIVQQNGVGIIDAPYQGSLRAPLINWSYDPQTLTCEKSLFQIIHPYLVPFDVERVDKEHFAFAIATNRGEGGFGSTDITANV